MSSSSPFFILETLIRWVETQLPVEVYSRGGDRCEQDKTIGQVVTDSRQIQAGDVFVALRGDRFDGHDYVAQCLDKGAIAAVVDKPVPDATGMQLVVKDTLAAYQAIARGWRRRFGIPVVGITGSAGKTSTKEAIAAVLGTAGKVHKTYANFNNEIGVPKTLLALESHHNFAVVEMAMRGAGQIAELAVTAEPTIAVITNVGTAHIGLLGSEQAIADAKCELLAELRSDGVAVLNADDKRLMATAAKVWSGQTVTYGLMAGDVRGEMVGLDKVVLDGVTLLLPLPGAHNARNFLAAIAVARILDIDESPLVKGIAIEMPEGRAKQHTLPGDIVLLDETYNAGLESMTAALHLLAQTPGQRRLALLGTMKELGDRAPEFHQQIGRLAAELKLDHLYVLTDDPTAEAIATGATTAATPIPCTTMTNHDEAIAVLRKELTGGDRLLLKASHSVGLEKVVQSLVEAQ
ncbi:MAG: UDP-N-acetylmuramoyl-tripeptide--D-alanyl-D-alanine ligase [Cyanobacteria bacterium P01_C01_bin.89]